MLFLMAGQHLNFVCNFYNFKNIILSIYRNMKQLFLFSLLLFVEFTTVTAQQKKQPVTSVPIFKSKKIHLRVPAFLPGIMKDSTALLSNDTLIYDLNCQL